MRPPRAQVAAQTQVAEVRGGIRHERGAEQCGEVVLLVVAREGVPALVGSADGWTQALRDEAGVVGQERAQEAVEAPIVRLGDGDEEGGGEGREDGEEELVREGEEGHFGSAESRREGGRREKWETVLKRWKYWTWRVERPLLNRLEEKPEP